MPEVLATLFDVSGSGDHESMGGASSSQPSSGGMCGTLKTLLMSSSYPVRSATARLISSLCSDGSSSVDGAGNTSRAGCFFREALIAARTTGKSPVNLFATANISLHQFQVVLFSEKQGCAVTVTGTQQERGFGTRLWKAKRDFARTRSPLYAEGSRKGQSKRGKSI